jgi:nucleoside-diphosphate-sugar epimerase
MTDSNSPWVILGCGYTGARLARRLAGAGQRVVATTRRRAPPSIPGVETRAADLRSPETLTNLIPDGAIVVHCAPPGPDVGGEENLLAAAKHARRLVYVSSTAVYPRGRGEWIDESCPVAPSNPRGEARLAAERVLLAGPVETVVLRSSGIYGPGRGVHVRIAAGTHRVIGAGDTYVSRIHVDDLAAAILAAGTADPLSHRVFNVADDEPATSRFLADSVAALLGIDPPPSVAPEAVDRAAVAMLTANRRISNRRLVVELGVRLLYPSWREGIPASLTESREEQACRPC